MRTDICSRLEKNLLYRNRLYPILTNSPNDLCVHRIPTSICQCYVTDAKMRETRSAMVMA